MDIVRIYPSSPLLKEVLQLWRKNRATLGFLPTAAFEARAAEAMLWGAIDSSGRLAGYVLYDLPRDEVSITHLCVSRDFRQRGVAKNLANHVARHHPYRRAIVLLCRRDYGLEPFWEKLGFVPFSEKPGRNARGLPLTFWFRAIQTRSLLDWTPGRQIPLAIDTNVLRDLHQQRTGSIKTREAFPDWIFGEVELVVTSQVFTDINRINHTPERQALRKAAHGYPVLNADPKRVEELVLGLRDEIVRRGRKDPGDTDLRHIAICAARSVPYLVTNDRALLKSVSEVASRLVNVRLLPPNDVLLGLDEYKRQTAFDASAIADTSVSLRRLRAGEMAGLEEVFLGRSAGERGADFRRLLESVANESQETLIVEEDGRPLVATSRAVRQGILDVNLLRVVHGPMGRTLAQQMANMHRIHAIDRGIDTIRVSDPHVTANVRGALQAEGFFPDGENWIGFCPRLVAEDNGSARQRIEACSLGQRTSSELAKVLSRLASAKPLNADEAASIEHGFRPLKVLNAEISTLLVPIKPAYAEDLFDIDLSRQRLFRRPTMLGMLCEHVYYKHPGLPHKTTLPARILWYVSGEPNRTGTKSVRAASQLTAVETDETPVLISRHKRYGVFTRKESSIVSPSGRATALKFRDTEQFRNPFGIDQLRLVMTLEGRGVMLQSTSLISTSLFRTIYSEGTTHG